MIFIIATIIIILIIVIAVIVLHKPSLQTASSPSLQDGCKESIKLIVLPPSHDKSEDDVTIDCNSSQQLIDAFKRIGCKGSMLNPLNNYISFIDGPLAKREFKYMGQTFTYKPPNHECQLTFSSEDAKSLNKSGPQTHNICLRCEKSKV